MTLQNARPEPEPTKAPKNLRIPFGSLHTPTHAAQARGRQGDVEYSIDVRGERRTDQSSQVEDLFLPDRFVVKFLAEDMHGLWIPYESYRVHII